MFESSLQIDQVKTPNGGVIGMCHCPGRRGVDGDGHVWDRQLDHDLQVIKSWGSDAVITLLQRHEFEKLGVENLDRAVLATPMRWYHLPVADMSAPADEFHRAFKTVGAEILSYLGVESEKTGKIVVHCAAGLGRTGTVAASLLILCGMLPQPAIAAVRRARPGAIETSIQEKFVRDAIINSHV